MNIKIFNIAILLMVLSVLASCAKWTDVKPSIEVRSKLVFSDEATVQEALNGVYGRMTQTAGYGRNMTWGFVDVMGEVYNGTQLANYEIEAVNGRFNNTSAEQVIEQMWNNTYTAIANANNLISSIEEADPAIFSGDSKNRIKGEALGLRAMLHFDLLRLFGPAVGSTAWNQPILPYVTVYSSHVTPRNTGPDIITRLLEDLQVAEDLLKEDPIRMTSVLDELRARKVRFNYYAVKALQARIYLWIGDKPKALEAATVVINAVSEKFPWTTRAGVEETKTNTFYDYILSSENIFSLYVNNLRTYIDTKLVNIAVDASVTPKYLAHYSTTEEIRQEVYEAAGPGVTDFRNILMIGEEQWEGTLNALLYKKLHQGEESTNSNKKRPQTYAANRIPLIKTAEMFYVAAECLADTHPDQAVGYLNTVRTNRGMDDQYLLPTNLSPADVHAEIRKEYRKEFPCEGQFFYYRKRMGERNYILPLPQWEQEYGF